MTVLGSTEEQKIFYFLLAIGGATLVGLTTIIVIKKEKRLINLCYTYIEVLTLIGAFGF